MTKLLVFLAMTVALLSVVPGEARANHFECDIQGTANGQPTQHTIIGPIPFTGYRGISASGFDLFGRLSNGNVANEPIRGSANYDPQANTFSLGFTHRQGNFIRHFTGTCTAAGCTGQVLDIGTPGIFSALWTFFLSNCAVLPGP